MELLEAAVGRDSRLVVVTLSRNFGHQAALTAALDHVTGDATVVMDGDLQDRPEAIATFLELFSQGYDVVYAKRVDRKEPWWLRLCYAAFYRLLARLSDIQRSCRTDAGDFGLVSRRVVEELRRLLEHHRYLRGLSELGWASGKSASRSSVRAACRHEQLQPRAAGQAGERRHLRVFDCAARAAAIVGFLAMSVRGALRAVFASTRRSGCTSRPSP